MECCKSLLPARLEPFRDDHCQVHNDSDWDVDDKVPVVESVSFVHVDGVEEVNDGLW